MKSEQGPLLFIQSEFFRNESGEGSRIDQDGDTRPSRREKTKARRAKSEPYLWKLEQSGHVRPYPETRHFKSVDDSIRLF